MKYTKEYICKMRAASHLLAPPASDVVNETLDEISRLQEINEMERRLSDEYYMLLVDDPNTKLKADQIMVNIFGKCEPSPSKVSTTPDVLMDIKKDDTCPECGGVGEVAGAYFSDDGITTCDRCNGKGTV